MHGLILEEGSFGNNPSTKDLARHLYTRMNCGKVVIVTDDPRVLLSPLRKQWLRLARKVRIERARTLQAERIVELTNMVSRMYNLRFTTDYPLYEHPGDVYLATLDQLLHWAPECKTMYVTCDVPREQLYLITAWMPKNALVVLCRLDTA